MAGYILSGILLLILAGIAIRHLCNNRRLKQLSENMEDYLVGIGGNLPLSLKEDTIAQVENAAMEMQNRIDVAEERFRQEAKRTSNLTADISHQLKTPLASLRLYCEMDAQNGNANAEKELRLIEKTEHLVAELLKLQKIRADSFDFTFEDAALHTLTEETFAAFRPLYPQKRFELSGTAVLRCDRAWLEEAFSNIVKNACEHTPKDGRIPVPVADQLPRIPVPATAKFVMAKSVAGAATHVPLTYALYETCEMTLSDPSSTASVEVTSNVKAMCVHVSR